MPSPPQTPADDRLAEIKAAGRRWGLDEFVVAINGLVEHYLPAERSLNAKLRGDFTPRLVRYYGTFGLISPPEREGKEARYTYGHLLQALVIRRLLFEGFTAPALLKMLAGKREADYEALLTRGVSVVGAASVASGEAKESIDSSDDVRLVRELAVAEATPVPVPAVPSWRRVEIAPGLEVHLRGDFCPPTSRAGRESLLLAVLKAVATAEQTP